LEFAKNFGETVKNFYFDHQALSNALIAYFGPSAVKMFHLDKLPVV
jgi:hypothetical protein